MYFILRNFLLCSKQNKFLLNLAAFFVTESNNFVAIVNLLENRNPKLIISRLLNITCGIPEDSDNAAIFEISMKNFRSVEKACMDH